MNLLESGEQHYITITFVISKSHTNNPKTVGINMSADATFLDNVNGKYLQIFEYTQYMEYLVLLNTYDQNCTYMIRVH